MKRQLQRIGIDDNAAGRTHVQQHLNDVYVNPNSVARIQPNGRTVRESLLMGPRGGVKVQSIWQGRSLVTVELYGGR